MIVAAIPVLLVAPVVAIVALIVVALLAIKAMYKIAEPNEALIISGANAHHAGTDGTTAHDFKIIVGKGAYVIPGFQTVRSLSLDIHEAELSINCVTTQGIQVGIKAVVIYKIADDPQSIANAARRFLEQEDQMDGKVYNVFAGHLRSIVGSMTVEDLIRERDKLTSQTRASSADELSQLGLRIDSLQIQEIDDPTGYIENLAKPQQAAVNKAARIAQAQADREAAEAEAEANAKIAEAQSSSEIQQAAAAAKANTAKAESDQAGPLAAAQAKKAVVEQETEVARLEAEQAEQRLQSEVVKPAEAQRQADIAAAEAQAKTTELKAQADATKVKLEAEADAHAKQVRGEAEAAATKATGLAEAETNKAKALAEADGIKARAEALSANQDAVINQQIAEKLPEIVRAGAEAFSHIGSFTVLNGAEGVADTFASAIGMGASMVPLLRKALTSDGETAKPSGNGVVKKAAVPAETTDEH